MMKKLIFSLRKQEKPNIPLEILIIISTTMQDLMDIE